MKRLTKKNVIQVQVSTGMVLGLVTMGIFVGAGMRKIGEKLGLFKSNTTALMSGDPIIDAAKDL